MKIQNGILVSVENSDIVGGKLVVPDSITTIGRWAFDGSTALKDITLPDSITSIWYGAFNGCTSLKPATKNQRKEILAIAKRLLPEKDGLCACLDAATREYSLQKHKAFSVCTSFPDFTRENAMQFGADEAESFWWTKGDKESRMRFLEWLENN